jgi:hypothetical protein
MIRPKAVVTAMGLMAVLSSCASTPNRVRWDGDTPSPAYSLFGMAIARYRGIDQLVEETIRSAGSASLPEVMERLGERGITKGQVRNAVYRLKVRGKIGVRADGSTSRYEGR